jgi:hypothetical protein
VKVSWNDFDGRSLLPLVAFVVFGCVDIHKATQFTGAIPTETTTIARNVYMHQRRYFYNLLPIDNCRYDFSVGDRSFRGDGVCPNISTYDSIKAKLSNSVRDLPGPDATVYYDPVDPSINSLTEFSARSETEYRNGIGWIGLGSVCSFPFVLLALLNATKSRKHARIFVDARGTVIYPDEINYGSEFGRTPVSGGGAEATDAAASETSVREKNFAASHGLRELYLDVIKQIHPDHASSEADRTLRERLTKDANIAFEQGDDATLRRVLEEYESLAPQR